MAFGLLLLLELEGLTDFVAVVLILLGLLLFVTEFLPVVFLSSALSGVFAGGVFAEDVFAGGIFAGGDAFFAAGFAGAGFGAALGFAGAALPLADFAGAGFGAGFFAAGFGAGFFGFALGDAFASTFTVFFAISGSRANLP